ncbi:unnamed protein product [Diamesa hyperborea]
MNLSSVCLVIIVSVLVLQINAVPVQLNPLKNAVETLSATPLTTAMSLTVESTTALIDDQGTTEFPSYGGDEDDNIGYNLLLSLAGGPG